MKEQKGMRLVAPETIDYPGTVRHIKLAFVSDGTQTQELSARAA